MYRQSQRETEMATITATEKQISTLQFAAKEAIAAGDMMAALVQRFIIDGNTEGVTAEQMRHGLAEIIATWTTDCARLSAATYAITAS